MNFDIFGLGDWIDWLYWESYRRQMIASQIQAQKVAERKETAQQDSANEGE